MNSYFAIAETAYNGIMWMYGTGASNEFAASAQRTAERYLKAVIEKYPPKNFDATIMETHSTIKLYNAISHLNYLGIERQQVRELDGYIFLTYPGAEYRVVSKEEETLCLEALIHVRAQVTQFMYPEFVVNFD